MNGDDLRSRLPIVGPDEDGEVGYVLLNRRELPGGGTETKAVDPELLAELFAGVDWTDRAALVAADRRKVRRDRVHGEEYRARPDGSFAPDVPTVNPDDVVEVEVDLGYAEHLARWHDEGRFS